MPLHLCRISSILTLVFLKTKNKKLLDIIFYFSLFAIGSLFYPKDVYHFMHINGISYMINHLITVAMPVFVYIAYDWRPSFKGLKSACLWFSIYLVFIYWLNPIIGGNYFYLVNRPFLNNLTYFQYFIFTFIATYVLYFIIYGLYVYIYHKVTKGAKKKAYFAKSMRV